MGAFVALGTLQEMRGLTQNNCIIYYTKVYKSITGDSPGFNLQLLPEGGAQEQKNGEGCISRVSLNDGL